jgi:hypothetical protein
MGHALIFFANFAKKIKEDKQKRISVQYIDERFCAMVFNEVA